MGPPKSKTAPPSGRALMTAQQKKDADKANIGVKAAAKAAKAAEEEAAGPKMDKDKGASSAPYKTALLLAALPVLSVGCFGEVAQHVCQSHGSNSLSQPNRLPQRL